MREGYKKTKLGEIPEDWEVAKIGDIADVTAGGTPSTKVKEYWGGQIPWMNSGEINLRRIKGVEGRITETGLGNSSTRLIPKNSVLMALAGQGKTRGKVAVNEFELCTNQSLAALYNFTGAFHEFIFQNLESRYWEIRKMSTGDSGRGGLNLTIIKSIQLPLPPLPEQKKIAQILSTVDEKIDLIEEQITETQALKKGLMQRLLTRGIGHAEFKNSKLGEIPVGWEVKRLDKLCSYIQDGTHFSPKSSKGEYKYITSKNIKFGRLDLSNCSYISKEDHDIIYSKCKAMIGDILLTKDGAKTGNACINPLTEQFSLLSSVAVLRSDPKMAINQFIFQVILSPVGQKIIRDSMAGQAITRITLSKIGAFKFPRPPLPEQHKIADILSTVDQKLEVLKAKKGTYQELKRGLMQVLLTGKIRVK